MLRIPRDVSDALTLEAGLLEKMVSLYSLYRETYNSSYLDEMVFFLGIQGNACKFSSFMSQVFEQLREFEQSCERFSTNFYVVIGYLTMKLEVLSLIK